MLVSAVVVQNQVNVQLPRQVFFNVVKELAKLFEAMPMLRLPDNLFRLGVERGKHAGCAVKHKVIGAQFDLSRAHRQ